MLRWLSAPSVRPFVLLAAIVAVLALVDFGQGRFWNVATAFSVLQQFATIGPVALALGLSMIVREFDLSVGGMLSLAGCLAVMTGTDVPALGVAIAILAGCVAGLVQGGIMVWLGLSSVGVTLGGLLTLGGLTYVLTGNATIGYDRMDVAMLVNHPVLGVFSLRNGVAIGAFVIAAVLMAWTRIGRDVVAVGSDRRAALVAGVGVDRILIGVFVVSGMLTALAGSLLSYSLAAASPVALADTLVPAAAAAIIGGVSLSGGKGTPIGIAGGVLVLAVLRSGLTAIGVPPFAHDIVTGAVLLAVALLDAGDLERRLFGLASCLWRHPRPEELTAVVGRVIRAFTPVFDGLWARAWRHARVGKIARAMPTLLTRINRSAGPYARGRSAAARRYPCRPSRGRPRPRAPPACRRTAAGRRPRSRRSPPPR